MKVLYPLKFFEQIFCDFQAQLFFFLSNFHQLLLHNVIDVGALTVLVSLTNFGIYGKIKMLFSRGGHGLVYFFFHNI